MSGSDLALCDNFSWLAAGLSGQVTFSNSGFKWLYKFTAKFQNFSSAFVNFVKFWLPASAARNASKSRAIFRKYPAIYFELVRRNGSTTVNAIFANDLHCRTLVVPLALYRLIACQRSYHYVTITSPIEGQLIAIAMTRCSTHGKITIQNAPKDYSRPNGCFHRVKKVKPICLHAYWPIVLSRIHPIDSYYRSLTF